jgi:hypothetical protein
MNPLWLSLCFLAQGLLLQWLAPWPSALGLWMLLSLIFALFAWSRLRWNQHLDMLLIMLGPASLSMQASIAIAMPNCPFRHTPAMALQHFGIMSAAMLAVSLPLTWRYARCVQSAKAQQRAISFLLLDSFGMIAGMAIAHATWGILPSGLLVAPWFEHAVMLIGMTCGMMPAAILGQRFTLPASFSNIHVNVRE